MSLSFPTISSSGCNGAVVHYCPTLETARKLSTSELYLCDSGAQYFDGTTDITRTVSFGTPSPKEKVCKTAMLFTYRLRHICTYRNALRWFSKVTLVCALLYFQTRHWGISWIILPDMLSGKLGWSINMGQVME